LQNHHESALPSQRYKMTRELPVKLNPIVPQDVSPYHPKDVVDDVPTQFSELNAPRQRAPQLGNPIFGYSTHPMPPPVVSDETPRGGRSKSSSAANAKLQELQEMLQEERSLRKKLEAELATAKR
jgi:hypothetical protein